MHCHLLIPGLLWSQASFKEVSKNLGLPALGAMLGRGGLRWLPPVSAEQRMAQEFGLSGEEAPFAPLRLVGEGSAAADGAWICADPVHLRFARDVLILTDARDLGIEPEETTQLIAALNEHFAGLGRFHAPAPERWYLHLERVPAIRTHPVTQVVGRRVDAFLPEGAEATQWRRHINEAQVLLHTHAVNREREERGQALINSVWFWGAGALPSVFSPSMSKVLGDSTLLTGLAKASGIPLEVTGAGYMRAAHTGDMLIVLEQLGTFSRHLDMEGWRETLREIERHWFSPALAALRAGAIDRLMLTALGDEAQLQVTVHRRDLWKLWRASCPLADLNVPETQA